MFNSIFTQVKLKRAKYSNHIRYDRQGDSLSYTALTFNGCPLYVKPECEKYSIVTVYIYNREYCEKLGECERFEVIYTAAYVMKLASMFAQYDLLIKK